MTKHGHRLGMAYSIFALHVGRVNVRTSAQNCSAMHRLVVWMQSGSGSAVCLGSNVLLHKYSPVTHCIVREVGLIAVCDADAV